MKLAGLFYKVIDTATTNTASSLIKSAGVGLVSGAAVYLLIQTYVNGLIGQANSLPVTITGLMAVFGIDKGLCIILGAVLTRASLNATKVSFMKKGA